MNMRDRDMRGMDGRRLPPRNARGEFRRRRSRRGDRGMPMRDMNYDGRMSYPNRDYGDMRGGDYAQNQMAYRDMRSDYRSNDMVVIMAMTTAMTTTAITDKLCQTKN